MWLRSDLKWRGKRAVLRNFWAAVAVCFLLAFIGAEFSGSTDFIHRREEGSSNYHLVRDTVSGTLELAPTGAGTPHPLERMVATVFNAFTASQNWLFKLFYGGLFVLGAFLMLFFSFLVGHPVLVGARHFFLHNRLERATPLEILSVFHHDCYLNVVLIMFLRWLFVLLWSCLLVIPGIVKALEYRMVPYLLADNPRMNRRRAFALSRDMMRGQKWDTFVLDLSFFPWILLSALTLNLVGIFFLNPYIAATHAELYAVLKADALSRGVVTGGELPMPMN